MVPRKLLVVTFGVSRETSALLREQLEGLGYTELRFVEGGSDEQADDVCEDLRDRLRIEWRATVQNAIVALVCDPVAASADLYTLEREAPSARLLGLVTGDVDWTSELVGHFDQIAGFPCQSGELGYRLRVLTRDPEPEHDLATELYLRQALLGSSSRFLDAVNLIRRFAPVAAPVLVEGETGTGKDLAAISLHRLSERADGPWVPVNCGAIPDGLFESEMFGHAKGAFTDARQPRAGLVELADGGTLFLDEVECLSQKGQVSLLRFLQSQEYRRVGDQAFRRTDVRVVAATNQPLTELVKAGAFREDLYYRLDILHVDLPPLRERASDVLLLAENFLAQFAAQYDKPVSVFCASTRAWLKSYDWPGNVRELENFVHREVLLTEGDTVRFSPNAIRFAERIGPEAAAAHRYDALFDLPFGEAKANVVNDFERQYLSACLSGSCGNVSAAANKAGKHRRAFDRLLQKHQIDKSSYR